MIKESQPIPERQKQPVNHSEVSPKYSTFDYYVRIFEIADTQPPRQESASDRTGPPADPFRHIDLLGIGSAEFHIISISRPTRFNPAIFIPDSIASISVADSLGGKRIINNQGRVSTEGDTKSVEIKASDGSVTFIDSTGRHAIPQADALATLETFCKRYKLRLFSA